MVGLQFSPEGAVHGGPRGFYPRQVANFTSTGFANIWASFGHHRLRLLGGVRPFRCFAARTSNKNVVPCNEEAMAAIGLRHVSPRQTDRIRFVPMPPNYINLGSAETNPPVYTRRWRKDRFSLIDHHAERQDLAFR